jgi:hypothetical protein
MPVFHLQEVCYIIPIHLEEMRFIKNPLHLLEHFRTPPHSFQEALATPDPKVFTICTACPTSILLLVKNASFIARGRKYPLT